LVNHYSGELAGFEQSLEKASEIASDEVVSESPQQQQPEHAPESPQPTQQESLVHEPSDVNTIVSEDPTQIESQIIVALPAYVAKNEPDFEITSVSDDEDEQPNQWFKPGFLNQPLSLSSPFVLESVHDPPFVPNNAPAIETNTSTIIATEPTQIADYMSIDLPSSSNQTCPPIQTTNVSFPPTLFIRFYYIERGL
jgi:hypothetical protein